MQTFFHSLNQSKREIGYCLSISIACVHMVITIVSGGTNVGHKQADGAALVRSMVLQPLH